MKEPLYFGFLLLLLFVFQVCEASKKLECFADVNAPKDDPNNIYKCDADAKCCKEQGLPSCCKPKPADKAQMEQIQLWGTLAGLIAVLALLMFCCRHDGDWCCNRKDGGRYKYFCCGPIIYREGKEPPVKDFDEVENDDSDDEKAPVPPDVNMQRPANAPPPYGNAGVNNVNETAPRIVE